MTQMDNKPGRVYVLDTTVLIYDPDILSKIAEADWVIPLVVIRELDGLKSSNKELVAKAARKIARTLDRLSSYGDLVTGVKLPTGRTLRVFAGYESVDALASDADNKILGAALMLKQLGEDVTLFTTDTNMRTVARAYGVKAEYTPFFDIEPNTEKEVARGKNEFRVGGRNSCLGQEMKRKRLLKTFKAFNRYFLPLKVKIALFLFAVISCASYYYSRDLALSFALGSLGIVLLWLLSGLVRGKTRIPVSYAGEDADGESIWIFRR